MKPRRPIPLERLADADAVFVDWRPDRGLNPHLASRPDRVGVYVEFNCPIHADCRVGVQMTPALDGGGPLEPGEKAWSRTGDTIESLTLSPSIRVLGGADGCEWHGFIRAGRFETCGDSR